MLAPEFFVETAFFSVWDLRNGKNSCLIVWKTVKVPLEAAAKKQGEDLKIVRRLIKASIGVQHVSQVHASFNQTSCFIHLQIVIA